MIERIKSEDAKAKGDDTSSLFRREAVRHNTPGLFGEVVLASPTATWVLTLISLAALALIGGVLFALDVDGSPLWAWLLTR